MRPAGLSGGHSSRGVGVGGDGVAAESSLPEGSVRRVRRGCGLGEVGGSDVPGPGLNLFNVQCLGFVHRMEREMLSIFLLLTSFYFSTLRKIRGIFLERIKVSGGLNVQT